jgi:hypothetical protein
MSGGDAPYDHEGDGGSAEGPPPGSYPSQPAAARPPEMPPEIDEPAGGGVDPIPSAAPAPPSAEPTGDERVDAALSRFAELTAAPVADHVEVFEDVQRRLQDVLASVDHEEQAEPAAPASGPRPGQRPEPRPGPPNWGAGAGGPAR